MALEIIMKNSIEKLENKIKNRIYSCSCSINFYLLFLGMNPSQNS